MVNNSRAGKVAKYAIVLATIFVAMFLDRAISLGFPVSAATIVLLVTFSFALLENDLGSAIICCSLFGLASFVKEFIPFLQSSVALLPIYVRPVVTLVPRMTMGLVLFGVYRLMLTLTKKMSSARGRQVLSIVVAVFFALVTNTVLFLGLLNLFKTVFNIEHDSIIALIKTGLAINIPVEYLVSMLFVSPVVLGVRRGLKLGVDGNGIKQNKPENQAQNNDNGENQ